MSAANSNLDLVNVPTEDLEQLASKIQGYYSSDSSVKSQLSYQWERNQLMLDGKQWLMFQGNNLTGGQWQRATISKQNEYIPRPTTNYLFSSYQTLKSYLIKNKPRSTVRPNTQANKDKSAAKIANLILEANWVRLKEQYNYESAAATLITYGTVFKKSYWDTTTVSTITVPKMINKPITDPMTGAFMGVQLVQDSDPVTGDLLTEELPLGDVNTSVIDPFRMALDPLAMHLHECRWIMEYSVQPINWIKETFGKEGDGYTGLAAEVEEDTELNNSMRKWMQLKTSSGTKPMGASIGSGSSDIMVENCAVLKEYYERPSQSYPKGRLIVVAGDKVVYAGESPYKDPEQGDWHPYSECRWELTPGRFWGKSPLDDAVEIQKHINTIDSAIVLTRKTMAMPQKLIPIGSGISPGEWTGRPGQQLQYREQGGAIPSIIPGVGADASVFAERAQRIQDLKEIMGAIDIMQGERPQGVNAASALSLLYEVGTGKLYPILDRWKMFVEEDQKKQLKLVAQNYKEPRPEFIRMLKSRNTDLSEQEINQFIGSDLYDNWNVVVEAGSNIPKLQGAKQSMLVELAQLGMLNLQNPANRVQFQQDLGITGYDSDIEPDRKRATWENDLMDGIDHAPDNRPVVLAIDNHQLHLEEHQNRMKSPAFMSMSPAIQQAYMQHIQEHEQFQAMAQQAAMLQAQALSAPVGVGMPPDMAAPAPGTISAPPGNSPAGVGPEKGSGMGSDLKNAVMGSDVLQPAAIGGK